MTPYGNRSGRSGVVAFHSDGDELTVEYAGGAQYLYDARSPGLEHLRRMQELALRGEGLATYIAQHVRGRYARRVK